MPWTIDEFERWFVDFQTSDEGARIARASAFQHGVGAFSEDVRSEWYVSLRGTFDGYRRSGRALPVWLDGEIAARRYVVRALHNVSLTFGRQQGRSRERLVDAYEGRDPREIADRRERPPEEAVLAKDAVAAMVETINAEMRAGTAGCPGCRAEDAIRIALAALELIVWSSDPPDNLVDGKGGRDEWSQIVYQVMDRLYPDRSAQNGRRLPRDRKFHERCGGCALALLVRAATRHLVVDDHDEDAAHHDVDPGADHGEESA